LGGRCARREQAARGAHGPPVGIHVSRKVPSINRRLCRGPFAEDRLSFLGNAHRGFPRERNCRGALLVKRSTFKRSAVYSDNACRRLVRMACADASVAGADMFWFPRAKSSNRPPVDSVSKSSVLLETARGDFPSYYARGTPRERILMDILVLITSLLVSMNETRATTARHELDEAYEATLRAFNELRVKINESPVFPGSAVFRKNEDRKCDFRSRRLIARPILRQPLHLSTPLHEKPPPGRFPVFASLFGSFFAVPAFLWRKVAAARSSRRICARPRVRCARAKRRKRLQPQNAS